jgi:ribosome biogenesis GTPase
MNLIELGWNSFFDAQWETFKDESLYALRIVRENREQYLAYGELGEFHCEVSGKFRHNSNSKSKYPAVGDWVAASVRDEEKKATIHAVFERKSFLSRKVVGENTDEQIVAANIDFIFIVTGLDDNYNLRRIERYLTMAWNSGAIPIVILNKADLCEDAESKKLEVESIAIGVDVLLVSSMSSSSLELLKKYTNPGKTIAFIGSSGVGKSTLINSLLGTNKQKVNSVSGLGSRGKHTTTYRELILLDNGCIVIDTPGMRELQLWGDEDGLKQTFDDIKELALYCKYKDCNHISEPGCAILEAVKKGNISQERLDSYYKLKKELSYLEDRLTLKPSVIEKSRSKKISKLVKNYYKNYKDKT